MNYKKLIIIPYYCFEKRTNALFSIKSLINKGVSVEYWDVSDIVGIIRLDNEHVEGVEYRCFHSKKAFLQGLKEQKKEEVLYVVFMTYGDKTYFCYRALSKMELDFACCVSGVLPSPYIKEESRLNKIKAKIRHLNSAKAWSNLFFQFVKRTPLLSPAKFLFVTCGKTKSDYKVGKDTVLIKINSIDYITSLNIDNNLVKGKYVVFLDQYLPCHPDNKIVGYQDLDEEHYYSKLSEFFEHIEEQYNCKVVIAAHPTAQCYKEKNPFDGRDIFFFKSQSLVKESIGVISHYTTAFSFAILFNKPSIVLVSDEMKEKMRVPYDYCVMFSELLDWPLVNIDNNSCDVRFREVNIDKYKMYKYNYITNKESEKRDNASIILGLLKNQIDVI